MAKTKTSYIKGKSGNPRGRPRGSKDKRTQLRELLQPHAADLVKKAVELAIAGDTTALRMCLDRIIPPYRARDSVIKVDKLTGSLTKQGQQIIAAMGKGEVSPSDASHVLQALAAQARIIEVDELEQRVRKLEGQKL